MSFENESQNGGAGFGRHYPPSRDEYEDPWVPYLKLAMKLIVPIIMLMAVAGYYIQSGWH